MFVVNITASVCLAPSQLQSGKK